MVGRRSKFTPETEEKLVTAIRLGATYELACKYAGISYQTFNEWRNGRGFPRGTTAEQKAEFSEAIEKAEGDAAVQWLAKIEKAASDGSWQAAAWKMERRYPAMYGRNVVEHVGKDGGPIQADLGWLPDAVIDAAMAALLAELENGDE